MMGFGYTFIVIHNATINSLVLMQSISMGKFDEDVNGAILKHVAEKTFSVFSSFYIICRCQQLNVFLNFNVMAVSWFWWAYTCSLYAYPLWGVVLALSLHALGLIGLESWLRSWTVRFLGTWQGDDPPALGTIFCMRG